MAGKEISDENLEETRLLAQDLFEAKIQIVEIMAQLDPLHPWLEKGAKALLSNNSRIVFVI